MSYPLRFLALLAVFATPAFGATVEAINDDASRIILKLTQAELAAVEDDQTVLIEVAARPTVFVVTGKLTKVNPVKKTVVVILQDSDLRFEKRQGVRFLSLFFNPLLSPLITSYSQYHPYARSGVEGGIGYFYEKYLVRSGESRDKTVATGLEIALESNVVVKPRSFGGGVGYRRFGSEINVSADGKDVSIEDTINQIRPGIWFEVDPGFVLGLRYDYSMDEEVYGDGGPVFNYSLGEANLGLTYYGPDYEWNLHYKDKASFTAIDTMTDGAEKFTVENTTKTPATLDISVRDVQSPLFGWGLGVGYVFYERELKKGLELRSKPTPAEVLKGRLMLEWRLDDGSKVDSVLSYAGGRASSRFFSDNIANKVGLSLTYLQPFLESLAIGGTLAVEGGAITLADQEVNSTTGEVDEVAREVETVGASLLAFVRTEFDLLAKGRRR